MHDPKPIADDPGREEVPSDRADALPPPERIGRYRIERLLGQGGFGLVYLAHDDQLARPVAIKVPHARLVVRPEVRRSLSDGSPHRRQPGPSQHRAGA